MYTILGAGLAGLSCAYHLGHEQCKIFEQHDYVGGHIHSEQSGGFTWDEGPHVSFTKSDYVRQLFDDGIDVLKYPVHPVNYYQGTWIDHPAQTNLYVLPEALKQACVSDFLAIRKDSESADFAPKTTKNGWNLLLVKHSLIRFLVLIQRSTGLLSPLT